MGVEQFLEMLCFDQRSKAEELPGSELEQFFNYSTYAVS
jgi:hypothetical protein